MPKEQEVREVIRRFCREGWKQSQGKGSHVIFSKDGLRVSVPTSRSELALGTYRAICKAAGWR